ncbi:MAG: type II toxin-antitoxin system RelE/ParE family toxin [Bacteroidota bacterium]
MSLKIEWSPRSEKEYLNLIDYLLKEWGEKSATKFSDRLQNVLSDISKKPQIYPSTERRKDVRRCVVSKQISLYYRIKKDRIEIITLFDNRQSPSKRKL